MKTGKSPPRIRFLRGSTILLSARSTPGLLTSAALNTLLFLIKLHSTLRYVHAQAEKHNLGVDVELVPSADDPKDLFRHTRSGTSRTVMRRVA